MSLQPLSTTRSIYPDPRRLERVDWAWKASEFP